MPSLACQNEAIRNADSSIALHGWRDSGADAGVVAADQRHQQADHQVARNASAIAVTRWHQKWWVPSLAEPRPRAVLSGVAQAALCLDVLMRHPLHQRHEPDQRGQHQAAEHRDPAAADERSGMLVAVAGVLHQMADAVEQVVGQRPATAEQDEEARAATARRRRTWLAGLRGQRPAATSARRRAGADDQHDAGGAVQDRQSPSASASDKPAGAVTGGVRVASRAIVISLGGYAAFAEARAAWMPRGGEAW